jgi:hypothetical protein
MVMAEKDSVGWKRYNPLTGEERRMYNAMVTPPINPHPFFSDEFEQAGVTHLSSVGGTPIFYYPESTTHLTEGEDGGAPTPILSGGQGLRWGAATLHPAVAVEDTVVPLLADEGRGVGRRGGVNHGRFGRAVSPYGWGDASLSTVATEVVTVVTAGDTAAATPEGALLPAMGETELVTSAAPLRVVAPAPTPPEEDTPRTLRRSSRNAGKADEHTLLKAERLCNTLCFCSVVIGANDSLNYLSNNP